MPRSVSHYDSKLGKFVDGPAAPSVLPERLAKLPSELVTKEIEDDTRAHELDPQHVIDSIVEDFAQKQLPQPKVRTEEEELAHRARRAKLKELFEVIPAAEHAPLTQARVNARRFSIVYSLVNGPLSKRALKPMHLWFDKDDVNGNQGLREGNAPADSDRPKHLRGLDLSINVKDFASNFKQILDLLGADDDR